MKYRLASLLLVIIFIAACSSEDDTRKARLRAAASAIEKGKTTREQVQAALGPPQSTKTQTPIPQPPGAAPLPVKYAAAEEWAYWSGRSGGRGWFRLPFVSSAAAKESSTTVIFFFDPQGVVLDCQTEETHP